MRLTAPRAYKRPSVSSNSSTLLACVRVSSNSRAPPHRWPGFRPWRMWAYNVSLSIGLDKLQHAIRGTESSGCRHLWGFAFIHALFNVSSRSYLRPHFTGGGEFQPPARSLLESKRNEREHRDSSRKSVPGYGAAHLKEQILLGQRGSSNQYLPGKKKKNRIDAFYDKGTKNIAINKHFFLMTGLLSPKPSQGQHCFGK